MNILLENDPSWKRLESSSVWIKKELSGTQEQIIKSNSIVKVSLKINIIKTSKSDIGYEIQPSNEKHEESIEIDLGSRSFIEALDIVFASSTNQIYVGDRVKIVTSSKHAFGSAESIPFIPKDSDLLIDMVVLSLSDNKELGKYETILAKSIEEKDAGNGAFQENENARAEIHYKHALDILRFQYPEDSEFDKRLQMVRLTCWSNLAAVQIRLKNMSGAKQSCTQVLQIDGKNIKALYRRSIAYAGVFDFEKAKQDITYAIQLSPDDSALKIEYDRIKKAEALYKKKSDAAFASFSKAVFS